MQIIDKTLRHKVGWIAIKPENTIQCLYSLKLRQIPTMNIGKTLSNCLNLSITSKSFLPQFELNLTTLFVKRAKFVHIFGIETLAIYNTGILFEPFLGLNPNLFIKDQSKNIFIILLWDGYYEYPGLFFWDSKQKNIGFNFSDIFAKKMEL